MGLRWHIVQKTLPQYVKERVMAQACTKKPSRRRLDVQQPPWSTFVAGGFLPGGFASVQSRRWTAVWVKFWLRRMGNEYFAIDRE